MNTIDQECGDGICHEDEGCPTDIAELQRQWRVMREALQPFADVGSWFFARPQVPDETPVFELIGLNGHNGALTRGQFKAANLALRPLAYARNGDGK